MRFLLLQENHAKVMEKEHSPQSSFSPAQHLAADRIFRRKLPEYLTEK